MPWFAAALTVAVVAAGCGSSGSSKSSNVTASTTSTTAGSRGGSGSSPSCRLAPASEVSAALGLRATGPESTVVEPATTCRYAVDGNPSGVIVRFQTGETAGTFEAEKSNFHTSDQETTDLPGVGDEAFTSTLGAGSIVTNTVMTRQGDTTLLVTAGAPLDKIEAYVRDLLKKL
jgi:hypothetical protein